MSASYEAIGSITDIMEAQQINDTFRKREFVIEIKDGMYPQLIKFQLTQDRCEQLSRFSVGQEVKVHFNLRGRQFSKREGGVDYWLNLEAWRIEPSSSSSPDRGDQPAAEPVSASGLDSADADDLPF